MISICVHLRSSAVIFFFVLLALARSRSGFAEESPFPGVLVLDALSERSDVPPGLRASVIEIDWTHPELKVELLGGGEGSDADPGSIPIPSWRNLLRRYPEALLIGMENDGRWGDYASVGDLLPWDFRGTTVRERNGYESRLSEAGERLGLNWLGRPDEWRDSDLPDLRSAQLFSTFDPATGRSRFVLIANPAERRRDAREIGHWMESAVRDTNWVALHADGSAGRIFLNGEELTPRAKALPLSRRPAAVLVVRPPKAGEEFDWAKHNRTRVRASASERGFSPELVISGQLWGDFAPPKIWTGRAPKGRDPKLAWIELTLQRAEPIHAIRLILPSAVGWSRHFNPARMKLEAWGEADDAPVLSTEITDAPEYDVSEIDLESPIDIRRVRIEFLEPTAMAIPGRARLAGVQLLGARRREP